MLGGVFGGDPIREQQLRNTYSAWADAPDPDVGVMTGALKGPVVGIKHGMDVAAAALADVAMPVLEKITPDSMAEWLESERQSAYLSLAQTRADPKTMGIVGQIGHALGSVMTMGAMGAAAAPVAGLSAVGLAAYSIGGLSGYDKYKELRDLGVDETTAMQAAGVTGTVMGVGAGLPPFLGATLARQVASGVGLNVALGVGERASIGAILETDYPKVAEHYKAMDASALAIDAILGAAFPLGARMIRRGGEPSAAEVDTAMQGNRGVVEQTRDPALQTTLEGIDAKLQADLEVTRQIVEEGRPLSEVIAPRNVMDDVTPNPEFARVATQTARAVDEFMAQEFNTSLKNVEQDIANIARAFTEGAENAVQVRVAKEMDVRQQARDGEAVAGRDAEGKEAAGARPEAQEEVTPDQFTNQAARNIVEVNPAMLVQDANGNTVEARALLEKAEVEFQQQQREASLYKVAVACAIGVGE